MHLLPRQGLRTELSSQAAVDQLRAICQKITWKIYQHLPFFKNHFPLPCCRFSSSCFFALPSASRCTRSNRSLFTMLSARFIACSNRYTSFSRSPRKSLGDDANIFRACFNVSLNVASSVLCLFARKSYDFENFSAENSPAVAKNRGSRGTFSTRSIYFILEEIGLTILGTSTTVRLLVTGLLDVTSIGLRTLFLLGFK